MDSVTTITVVKVSTPQITTLPDRTQGKQDVIWGEKNLSMPYYETHTRQVVPKNETDYQPLEMSQ